MNANANETRLVKDSSLFWQQTKLIKQLHTEKTCEMQSKSKRQASDQMLYEAHDPFKVIGKLILQRILSVIMENRIPLIWWIWENIEDDINEEKLSSKRDSQRSYD